jgi:hypothetical protein
MLIVSIRVNEHIIELLTVLRIQGGTKPDDINTYMLHNRQTIKHRYGDGACVLAKKMIENNLQSREKRRLNCENNRAHRIADRSGRVFK